MCSRSCPRQAEVPRHRLEPVAGQIAGREVVAPHGVQRVDQLAARPACSASVAALAASAARDSAPRRAPRSLAHAEPGQARRARAARRAARARRRGTADRSRAGCGSRSRPDRAPARAPRSAASSSASAASSPSGRLEQLWVPSWSAQRDRKMRSRLGIEPGGLQVELQAAQVDRSRARGSRCAPRPPGTAPPAAAASTARRPELAAGGATPGRHERRDAPWSTAASARAVVCAHQVAQRARPSSSDSRCHPVRRGPRLSRLQPRAQVRQVVQARRAAATGGSARLRARARGRRDAPPDERAPVRLGPHRHDARRGVPAPQPLVLDAAHGAQLPRFAHTSVGGVASRGVREHGPAAQSRDRRGGGAQKITDSF